MTVHLIVGAPLTRGSRHIRVLADRVEPNLKAAYAFVDRNAITWRDAIESWDTHFWAAFMRPDLTFYGSMEVPKNPGLPAAHHDEWATKRMFRSIANHQIELMNAAAE